jgi:hypothetical protein
MAASSLFLNELFSFNQDPEELYAEIENSTEFSTVKEKITEALKGLPIPPQFFSSMLSQLNALLHLDLGEIMAKAWCDNGALTQYLDTQKYAPTEALFIPLNDHKIVSDHTPILKPYINDIAVAGIPLQIHLELNLKNVFVKIQEGKVMEIDLKSLVGNCSVHFYNQAILEKNNIKFPAKQAISLGNGFPIRLPMESSAETE